MEYKCAFYEMMIDIFTSQTFKTIFTSWPLFFFISILLFKKSISNLLNRLKTFSKEGATFEPLHQNIQNDPIKKDSIKKELEKQEINDFNNTSVEQFIKQMNEVEAIKIVSENIKQEIKNLSINEKTKTELLIVQLAENQLAVSCETIISTIFKSQVDILTHLNVEIESSVKIDAIKKYYDEAYSENPKLFSKYSFEGYLAFMAASKLIILDKDIVKTTIFSQYLLEYININRAAGRVIHFFY